MSHIVAAPFGLGLPYASIFDLSRRKQSKVQRSRPSEYFWQKAVAPVSVPAAQADAVEPGANAPDSGGQNSAWLDVDVPAISDSEDEGALRASPVNKPRKTHSLARLRQIAFRAFVPSAGSTRKSTVVATEILAKENGPTQGSPKGTGRGLTIFNSFKVKSRGAKTEVKRMVAVVKDRISSASPADRHPKTWEEFHRQYASEGIDILNPPPPPMDPAPAGTTPTPFHARVYFPPRPVNEPVRQLVINRLGFLGKRQFDPSDEATARAKARAELADELAEKGQAPESLDQAWERSPSVTSTEGGDLGVHETKAMMAGVRSGALPPETLEQHPVFRKIVKQCREMFGTSISMLTIMDEDRQIFLAESGLGGMREVSRDVTFCAHTILSGRKGFTILDTHKDWRFENGPLVQNFGSRFYAGVPLMAPNFDGSSESEDNACPLGTLCVVDDKPREAFGVEERRKLVYMAEYARREIEKWFVKKMEQKMAVLEASKAVWNAEVKRGASSLGGEVDEGAGAEEVIIEPSALPIAGSPTSSKRRAGFGRMKSSASLASTATTLPPSRDNGSPKSPLAIPGPGLFEDMGAVVRPKMQKVFDLATALIGDTLDLSLVYLLAVSPHGQSEELGRTLVISGHNMPLPVPVFDAGLHLRALRASEGGILYQNPSMQEAEEAALQPKPSSPEGGPQLSRTDPYASAMLVGVGPERQTGQGGFVLAGFTSDAKRVFGSEDVSYMKQFAHELEKYVAKLKL